MLIEFQVSGVGQLLIIILVSVTVFLHVVWVALALFGLLLQTIQKAANRG